MTMVYLRHAYYFPGAVVHSSVLDYQSVPGYPDKSFYDRNHCLQSFDISRRMAVTAVILSKLWHTQTCLRRRNIRCDGFALSSCAEGRCGCSCTFHFLMVNSWYIICYITSLLRSTGPWPGGNKPSTHTGKVNILISKGGPRRTPISPICPSGRTCD